VWLGRICGTRQEQRVAIQSRLRRHISDIAARTQPVFDEHLLAKPARRPLAHYAREEINRAAGCKAYVYPVRTCWITLRRCDPRNDRQNSGGSQWDDKQQPPSARSRPKLSGWMIYTITCGSASKTARTPTTNKHRPMDQRGLRHAQTTPNVWSAAVPGKTFSRTRARPPATVGLWASGILSMGFV
jgi:hypothetical protein